MAQTLSIPVPNQPPQEERPLPPLREDLHLLPGPRLGDGSPTWTLHDPVRNRYYRIGWMEMEILKSWNLGKASLVASEASQSSGLVIDQEEVTGVQRFLIQNLLCRLEGPAFRNHLLQITAATKRSWWQWLLHHYLFFRVPLLRPDRFLERTFPWVRLFFQRRFHLFLFIMGMFGAFLALRQWASFRQTFVHFISLEGIAYYGIAIAITKVIHELGHAYALKRHGLTVPTLGVAFLVLWPVLYTDASSSWRLTSRSARMQVAAAGVMAELMLAVMATFFWSFLPDGPMRSAVFLVAATTWIMTLLINLNPLMRFDGYYLFSDFIEVPNLQDRAFALGRWWLRGKLLGLEAPPPEQWPPGKRRVLLIYAFSTWIYRFVLFLSIALLVYHLFFKLLGIFLMMVEIIWFILRPIYSELKVWRQLMPNLRFNRNVAATLTGVGLLFFLMILPWRSDLPVPAIFRDASQTQLYSPTPARIVSLPVKVGSTVRAGDTVAVLESPKLAQDILKSEAKVVEARAELSLRLRAEEGLEEIRVAEQKLAEELANLDGLMAMRERLTLTAPFDGVVMELATGMHEGRWVNATLYLALIVSRHHPIFEGFINEEDLSRVEVGMTGTFYPDLIELSPIPVQLGALDRADSPVLDVPYLASVHGGHLPVKADPADGRLMAQAPFYRAWLTPKTLDTPLHDQIVRGVVLLKGKPVSFLKRGWDIVLSVLIRESGF